MPIIVVSDASPVRALNHLTLLSLCRELYGTVLVPGAVRLELLRPTRTCPAIDILSIPGFEVRAAHSSPVSLGLPPDLDPGETEAIVVAIELHANLLLMDKRKATDAARRLGLTTVGVLGVLLEARRQQLIPAVMPCVDRLVSELHFFVSAAVRSRLAQLAGE